MLGGGQHAALVSATYVGGDVVADLLRVLAKRARVDDGIGGVGVDVGIRKEIPVDADGAGFDGGDAAEGFGVFQMSGGPEGHRVRENRSAVEAHGDAAFEVGGHNQREL